MREKRTISVVQMELRGLMGTKEIDRVLKAVVRDMGSEKGGWEGNESIIVSLSHTERRANIRLLKEYKKSGGG